MKDMFSVLESMFVVRRNVRVQRYHTGRVDFVFDSLHAKLLPYDLNLESMYSISGIENCTKIIENPTYQGAITVK